MNDSFSERIKSYEDLCDIKLMGRVPVVIRLDIRNFRKVSKFLEKPFCPKILSVLNATLFQSIIEIDNAVFGYQFGDEINLILRNDLTYTDQPWHQNKIQSIGSIAASLATLNFMKEFVSLDSDIIPELNGDVIFKSIVFTVPNIHEAVNYLILRQIDCIKKSVNSSSLTELTRSYGKDKAIKMLHGKKSSEKILLLLSECDIDYDTFYPNLFKLGVAAYKAPKIIDSFGGEMSKNKWFLDKNIPFFSKNKDFISNILHTGADIFRADRDF